MQKPFSPLPPDAVRHRLPRSLRRFAVRGRRFWRRVPTGRLLLEMASIVVAVLLALGVKEWRDHRQHEQLARAALQNVAEEAQANRKALAFRIEKHDVLVRKLQGIQRAIVDEQPFTDSLRSGFNMGIWPLRGSAFRSAQAMQALPHMDPDVVAQLATLQRQVETVETFDNQIHQQFGRFGFYEVLLGNPYQHPSTAIDPLFAIKNLVGELVGNERALRRDYGALLERLRARGLAEPLPADTSATPRTR